ncbi:MAG: transposase [Armatimonadetes bacterium]|nr:transposase [Armatimonadota bacterium]
MGFSTLSAFRLELYTCFLKSSDALMDTMDALLTDSTAKSFVELSLAPCFQRKWHSLYKAMKNGGVDRDALQKLFANYAPKTAERLVLAVDASSIPRPCSKTARDRTYVHASNLPEGSKPVVAGWQLSALVVLPEIPSSWTYTLSKQRIPSEKTQNEVATKQLEAVVPFLPEGSLLLADGGYGNVAFLRSTEGIPCDKLCRLAKNCVFYAAPPPCTEKAKRGHPKWHGAKFDCKDASTQSTPNATYRGLDAEGQEFEVCTFSDLHFQKARSVSVTVLRVTRQGAKGTERDPK